MGKDTNKHECSNCTALCCQGLTIDITKPRNRAEIDALKWQLNYEPVSVYLLNRRWHLFVEGRCGYLGEDNLCTIYESRYDICRKHNPPDCERYMDWYDKMIETPEQLEAHLEAEKKRRKRTQKRKK